MYIADNPLSKNLAALLGYKGHYSRSGEFKNNLDLIEAKLNMNKVTIRKWIMGKENPMLASLKRICDLFGWDIYELFIDENKFLDIEGFNDEHIKIMKMLTQIKNKDILNGLMSMIKIGLLANGLQPK